MSDNMTYGNLGHSGLKLSRVGLGSWLTYGTDVDADTTMQCVHAALEAGINFLDTADIYGSGHSENILAKAIKGKRDGLVIASKFGYTFNEGTTEALGGQADPDYIRKCCEGSLRRLKTDRIDLYQFHLGGYGLEKAGEVRDVLEELVSQGKIRYYGWSTDEPESARFFAEGTHCTAIQQRLNIFEGNHETLEVCQQNDLASINRGPLAMGLLMVSRFSYPHIVNQYIKGRRPFGYLVKLVLCTRKE